VTPAPAAPGDLDPTFSTNGLLTTERGAGSAAIAVQPDGKILITASMDFRDSPGFVLERVRADGTSDGAFGDGGSVWTQFAGGATSSALALQPDGRIVVAGQSGPGQPESADFALARYLSDGSLDDSFSGDGLVTTDLTGRVTDVLVQPDGRIVVAGYGYPPDYSTVYFRVARFSADGSLDDSFAGDGDRILDLDGALRGMALAPDGGIVLAGNSKGDMAVVRLTPAGTLDASFSDDGVLTADPSGSTDVARDVVVQPDGKIVTAGHGRVSVPGSDFDRRREFELMRFRPDGELDPTFSGGVVTSWIPRNARARGLALQPNGKLIAVGKSSGGLAVARYLSDGTLDESFSYDGKLTTSFSRPAFGYHLMAIADDVALDPDGRIVVGGWGHWGWNVHPWALARYQVRPGPHDADADGVRDAVDRCPAVFASDGTGCARLPRSLSIRYAGEYDEFRGTISGGGFKCEVRQRVVLFKRRRGPDERIGAGRTGYDRQWEVSVFRPRGRYYARVKGQVYPSWGLCKRARSDVKAFRR
jgi:uncharacterized delta-60 repeat protein